MELSRGKQNFWNFLFSVFFIAALAAATYTLYTVQGSFPTSVSVFDAILMALATFRVTRLVVYDKIARWFRDLFLFENGFAHTVQDLLSCPWCIGVWSALIVSFFYFMFPWTWFVIFFLALAGMGSLLQVIANLIGWRAEHLKRSTEQL